MAWHEAIGRLLKLNVVTHSALLPVIAGDIPVDAQWHKCFLKFFHNVMNYTNKCTQICAHLAISNNGCSVSKSFHFTYDTYGIDSSSVANSSLQLLYYLMCSITMSRTNAVHVRSDAVCDLIKMCDASFSCDRSNLTEIIAFLCKF